MKTTAPFLLKSLKHYKKQNIKLAVLYFLYSLFFSAAICFVYSYSVSYANETDATFGVQDGIFLCANEKAQNALAENDCFSKTGQLDVKAVGIASEELSDRKVVLGSIDEGVLELGRISLLEGNMPQTENEIAIDKRLHSILYNNAKIGDKIQVLVPSDDGNKALELTLTGILNNFSSLHWDFDNASYCMPNALVSSSFAFDSIEYSFSYAEFDESTADTAAKTAELSKNEGIIHYCENQRSSLGSYALSVTTSLLPMVFLIISVAIFMLIILFAVASLNKRGRRERIGLLKIAGFSFGDIRKLYFFSSLLVIIPSAIIGLAAGTVLSLVMLSLSVQYISFHLNFALLLLSFAVITALAIPFSLMGLRRELKAVVIENLHADGEKAKKVQGTSFTSKNPYILYAMKNFILNPGEMTVSAVMAFFSVFIIVFAAFINNALLYPLQNNTPNSDVRVSCSYDYMIGLIGIPVEPELGISDTDYQALKNNSNIAEILGTQTLYINEYSESEDYPDDIQDDQKAQYDAQKKQYGFSEDYYMDESRLLGVESDVFDVLEKYTIAGSIDKEALKSGKQVVICRSAEYGSDFKDKVGDTIHFAQLINNIPGDYDLTDTTMIDFTVTIGALVLFDEVPTEDRVIQKNLTGLIWDEAAFDTLGLDMHYSWIYANVKDKENFTSLYDLLNDYKRVYGEYFIADDWLQKAQAGQKFYNAFSYIYTVVSICLGVFSLLIMTLSTGYKLAKRRKVFGYLRAAGLTQGQMFKTILTENLTNVTIGCILGLAAGYGLIIFACSTAGSGIEKVEVPVLTVILFMLLYFAGAVLASFLPIKKFTKASIIDSIRSE